MARKTKLMQRVEDSYQRPLERLLPELVNERGLSVTRPGPGSEQSHPGLLAAEAGYQRTAGCSGAR